MKSYITTEGILVYYYDPELDDYDQALKDALARHGINDDRIASIGVTKDTDFLRKKCLKWTKN